MHTCIHMYVGESNDSMWKEECGKIRNEIYIIFFIKQIYNNKDLKKLKNKYLKKKVYYICFC